MRYLHSARFSQFRCFRDTESFELRDINVFLGPNNSGKSALLTAIRRLVSADIGRHPPQAMPAGGTFLGPGQSLQIRPEDRRDGEIEAVFELEFDPDMASPVQTATPTASATRKVKITFGSNNVNVEPERDGWDLIRALAGKVGIIVIPEHRSLTLPQRLEAGDAQENTIREDIVHPDALLPTVLAWWFEDAQSKIEKLQQTASRLLGKPGSILVKPNPKDKSLMVKVGDDAFRHLQNLGAGIVEILTLAVVLSKYDGGLLLYEEPELHLHPEVQRRILDVLLERAAGAWQVLMTTHSNHLVRADGKENIAYFSIEHPAGDNDMASSKGDPNVPNSSKEARLVKVDGSRKLLRRAVELLGALPSGLIMSNKVIWVEGPSDAIYLKFFFDECMRQEKKDCLIEHHDYAFAFFGGALLHHTGFESEVGDALVNILSLHSGSYMLIDSDRAASGGELGKDYTKALMARTDQSGRIWLTAGRETENYLRDEVLCWAVTDKHEDEKFKKLFAEAKTNGAAAPCDRDFDVFSAQVYGVKGALGRKHASHATADENKVPFARDAVDMMKKNHGIDWLDRLDLKQKVKATIEFIQKT